MNAAEAVTDGKLMTGEEFMLLPDDVRRMVGRGAMIAKMGSRARGAPGSPQERWQRQWTTSVAKTRGCSQRLMKASSSATT